MPVAERTFAVPCPCSAVVVVTAGQAGTRVECPSCRAPIDVPRLRDLAALGPAVAADSGPRPAWDAGRGIAFGGAVVALLAALAALATVPVGGLFVPHPPQPDVVRRAVSGLPISTIHAAWTDMATSGLIQTPSQMEVRYGKFTRVTRGLSRVLWGVAAVAAVVAAAGFASRAGRGRQRGGA